MTPAPVVEPAPAPVIDQTPAPVVEPAPAPVIDQTPAPVVEPAPAPVEPAPAPVIDETPVAVEPAPAPVVEPRPRRWSMSAAPVVEPAPAPVVDPAPAPVVPAPAPVVEPAPVPVVEPAPAPVVEPAPAPVVEPAPAPAVVQPPPAAAVEPAPAVAPAPAPVAESKTASLAVVDSGIRELGCGAAGCLGLCGRVVRFDARAGRAARAFRHVAGFGRLRATERRARHLRPVPSERSGRPAPVTYRSDSCQRRPGGPDGPSRRRPALLRRRWCCRPRRVGRSLAMRGRRPTSGRRSRPRPGTVAAAGRVRRRPDRPAALRPEPAAPLRAGCRRPRCLT